MNLLEKLEAATEGSRALDEAIDIAIKGTYFDSKPYTTSIDAALTLVPEGYRMKHLSTGDPDLSEKNDQRYSQCILYPHLDNDKCWKMGIKTCEQASSPALALCIAALKARLANPAATNYKEKDPGG